MPVGYVPDDYDLICFQIRDRGLGSIPTRMLLWYTSERKKDKEDMTGHPLLTQEIIDSTNEELSAIEAELDMRKPEGEFVTLLDSDGLWAGFEPIEYGKVELAQDEFDQVDEWADKELSVSTFLGQY